MSKTLKNNERDIAFISGIILFAVAIIATFVIPFFFLITPFVFVIAIILICISKQKTQTKIISVLIPVCLLVLLFVIDYQRKKMESETYLIPKDFRGKFVIFFAEPCGTDIEYENGRRIYRIPNGGVLITKFKREAGYIDDEFYLVDNQGNKIPLPKSDFRDFNFNGRLSKTDNEPPRDKLSVFHTNFDTVLGKTRAFTVATYQEFEADFHSVQHYIEFQKKAEKKLKQCREN